MNSEKWLWVVTDETTTVTEIDGSKSGIDTGATYGEEIKEIEVNKKRSRISAIELKQNMSEFLEVVEEIFTKAAQTNAKIELDEIELSVEINGKGQVSLLGTGGEVGAKGAIKLKFKRSIKGLLLMLY